MRAAVAIGGVVVVTALIACGSSYKEEPTPPPADDAGATADGAPPPLECGDPGSQCVVVPPGWLVVAPVASATTPCPPYFTNPRVLLENPRSEGTTCTCACGAPTTGSCLFGSLAVGMGTTNAACDDATRNILVNGSVCRPLPAWQTTYAAIQGSPLAPFEVPCEATATPPPIAEDGRLTVCTSPPPAPCADGACVAVPSDLPVCLVRDGEHECPAGSPGRRVVVAEAAVVDERTCGPCTCSGKAQSCAAPKLTLYNDAQCTTSPTNVVLDGMCRNNTGLTRTHHKYEATDVGMTCSPTGPPSALGGDIATTAKQTICCR